MYRTVAIRKLPHTELTLVSKGFEPRCRRHLCGHISYVVQSFAFGYCVSVYVSLFLGRRVYLFVQFCSRVEPECLLSMRGGTKHTKKTSIRLVALSNSLRVCVCIYPCASGAYTVSEYMNLDIISMAYTTCIRYSYYYSIPISETTCKD